MDFSYPADNTFATADGSRIGDIRQVYRQVLMEYPKYGGITIIMISMIIMTQSNTRIHLVFLLHYHVLQSSSAFVPIQSVATMFTIGTRS